MNEVKVRTIKRYDNRKLYDTEQSTYVTLKDIAELIKGGVKISVINNKTKENITSTTLIQLLYEAERANDTTVPVSALEEIIIKGDCSFSGYIYKEMPYLMDRHSKGQMGDTMRMSPETIPSKEQVSPEETITQ